MRFLVGTYTEKLGHCDGRGPGIASILLDPASGTLRVSEPPAPIRNPAYLWLNTAGDRLYATSEICDFEGRRDGSITVFALGDADGPPAPLQTVSSGGAGPAYVCGDRTGRWLFVANYVEGNVAVLPVRDDGCLGPPVCVCTHSGSGPDKSRQEAPHPHAIQPSPDNRFVYVADLGTDVLVGYSFDASSGRLERSERATAALPAGSGPRHFLFHPNGRFVYVVLELTSRIAALRFDERDGSMTVAGTWSTLPSGWSGDSHAAELAVTRDGRHLYVSNRGHESIAGFAIRDEGGSLSPFGHWGTGGAVPRHFALTGDDAWLVVANQESGSVRAMERDRRSGELCSSFVSMDLNTPCFVLPHPGKTG